MTTGIVFDTDDAKAIALLKEWLKPNERRRIYMSCAGESESPWTVDLHDYPGGHAGFGTGHTLLQATRDALGLAHD